MRQTPDSGTPGAGENPFEDSEARLDSFLGELGQDESSFDTANRRQQPDSRAQASRSRRTMPAHDAESSFFEDLHAAHQAPMYRSGTIINDRFEVVKQLGAGGMGAVYLANDLHLKDQKALKMMLPGLLESKEAQERFIIEVKALQNLAHPGIVRVYDFGRDSDTGSYFFSMEYVEGATLSAHMARRGGQLPVDEAVEIIIQLLSVLSYAHSNLVHRDLKPLNIMLRPDGKILVLDFGLAKMMTPGQLTHSSMVLGTIYYQSPEQSIKPGEVDKRSDLYSVGVILYQLLTGEVPVGNIHPPSKKNTKVSRALDAVVMRCLESSPDARYQTADELRAALERLRRPPRKKRFLIACCGLALVLLGLFALLPELRGILQTARIEEPIHKPVEPIVITPPSDQPGPTVTPPTEMQPQDELAEDRAGVSAQLSAFRAVASNREWAPVRFNSINDAWERAEQQWKSKELRGLDEAYALLRSQIESAQEEAESAQKTWGSRLVETEARMRDEAQRATEVRVAIHAPEEGRIASAFAIDARKAQDAGEWTDAEKNYLAAIEAYKTATLKAEKVAERLSLLEQLDQRESEVAKLKLEAETAKAPQWASSQYERARDGVSSATNYRNVDDLEAAMRAYDRAAEDFSTATLQAIEAADKANAPRVASTTATANSKPSKTAEPGMPSGAAPIVDGSDGDVPHSSPRNTPSAKKMTLSPDHITLRSESNLGEFTIALNGRPASKEDIKGYRFVDGDRVGRMFTVAPSPTAPGTVCIQPKSDVIEPGSYELQILGDGQSATLRVNYAPTPMSVTSATTPTAEAPAGANNVIERLSVSLPEYYTTGQYIFIDLKGEAGRAYRWKIDDRVILEGLNKSALKVAAEKVGKHTISVEEFKDGALKSHWSDQYDVRNEAPWPANATQNVPTTFSASSDFGNFGTIQWSIDGNVLARTTKYTHVFTQKGEFDLICYGSDPGPGETLAFRQLCYRVTVR